MKRWQLAVIPVLLVANYFVMVVRHEGCHALVVLLTGGHITAFHVWPPRGANLSWITEAPRLRSAGVVQLQAMLPHLVAVGLVLASLWYLGGARRMGFWQLNVALTGVVFPLIDLTLSVGSYWFADNDFFFVFGPGRLAVRATLTFWLLVMIGLAVFVLWRRRAGSARATSGAAARSRSEMVGNVRP